DGFVDGLLPHGCRQGRPVFGFEGEGVLVGALDGCDTFGSQSIKNLSVVAADRGRSTPLPVPTKTTIAYQHTRKVGLIVGTFRVRDVVGNGNPVPRAKLVSRGPTVELEKWMVGGDTHCMPRA